MEQYEKKSIYLISSIIIFFFIFLTITSFDASALQLSAFFSKFYDHFFQDSINITNLIDFFIDYIPLLIIAFVYILRILDKISLKVVRIFGLLNISIFLWLLLIYLVDTLLNINLIDSINGGIDIRSIFWYLFFSLSGFLAFFNLKISSYFKSRNMLMDNKKEKKDEIRNNIENDRILSMQKIVQNYQGTVKMDTLLQLLDFKNEIELQKWLLKVNVKGFVIKDGEFTVASSQDLTDSIDSLLKLYSSVDPNMKI